MKKSVSRSRVNGFLDVNGRKIVNGAGEEVLLMGWGLGNWLLCEGYMWLAYNQPRFDRPRRIEAVVEELTGKAFAEKFWAVLAQMETGTAGSSLKTAAAADKVCAFAAEYELWNPDVKALRGNMLAAFEGLSAEDQQAAQTGFDAVLALVEACMEDWEANRGVFEDAGVAETMDEIVYDPLNRLAWRNLRDHTLTMGNE